MAGICDILQKTVNMMNGKILDQLVLQQINRQHLTGWLYKRAELQMCSIHTARKD
jgi:hypothetical protein